MAEHTFSNPPTEYDDDGEPIWTPTPPSFTITRIGDADA